MALPLAGAIAATAARLFAAVGGRAAVAKLGQMMATQGGRQAIKGGAKKAFAAFNTPAGRRKVYEALKDAGQAGLEQGAADFMSQAAQSVVGDPGAAGPGLSSGPRQTGPTAEEAAETAADHPRESAGSTQPVETAEPRQRGGFADALKSMLRPASSSSARGAGPRIPTPGDLVGGLFGGGRRGSSFGGGGSAAPGRAGGGGFWGSNPGQYAAGALAGGATAMATGGIRLSGGFAQSFATPGTAAVAQDAAGVAADGATSLLTGNVIGFAGALAEGTGNLSKWSRMLLESQRGVAQFSGEMAMVFARHEVRNIRRAIDSGAATADSAGALQDAMDDRADALQPLRDDFTSLSNLVATIGLRITNPLAKITSMVATAMPRLVPGFDAMKELAERAAGVKPGPDPFTEIMIRGAAEHDGIVRPPAPVGRGIESLPLDSDTEARTRRRRRR